MPIQAFEIRVDLLSLSLSMSVQAAANKLARELASHLGMSTTRPKRRQLRFDVYGKPYPIFPPGRPQPKARELSLPIPNSLYIHPSARRSRRPTSLRSMMMASPCSGSPQHRRARRQDNLPVPSSCSGLETEAVKEYVVHMKACMTWQLCILL